jgi:UDPglucose--hexose-1-phosphate uridylyltransferase
MRSYIRWSLATVNVLHQSDSMADTSSNRFPFGFPVADLPKPELRKDPVTGSWVIIATERAKRPLASRSEKERDDSGQCPFCEGHEHQTPPEILAVRDPSKPANGEGWRVRVIPNRFPALRPDIELDRRCEGIYETTNGVGAHEIIIECPSHEVSMARLSEKNIREVIALYRERLINLKQDRRLAYGMIFKNVGMAAGASLGHSHSQLIATPVVPVNVQAELDGSREFFDRRGRCIYCEMIEEEAAAPKRILLRTPHFLSFAPFAARFPFETWILPREHGSRFEEISPIEITELAAILRSILQALESALDRPPYNYVIHTAPLHTPLLSHYHWHIEILPRLTELAGFEWGTGFHINPVPPEQAAEFLRKAVASASQ